MNKQTNQASVATTVTRRGFVEGAAGLMFAFTLGGLGRVPDALGATQVARINAWVGLHPLGWTGVMPFNWPSAGRVPLQT